MLLASVQLDEAGPAKNHHLTVHIIFELFKKFFTLCRYGMILFTVSVLKLRAQLFEVFGCAVGGFLLLHFLTELGEKTLSLVYDFVFDFLAAFIVNYFTFVYDTGCVEALAGGGAHSCLNKILFFFIINDQKPFDLIITVTSGTCANCI